MRLVITIPEPTNPLLDYAKRHLFRRDGHKVTLAKVAKHFRSTLPREQRPLYGNRRVGCLLRQAGWDVGAATNSITFVAATFDADAEHLDYRYVELVGRLRRVDS